MRINKFVAQATGLSRRAADTAIVDGRVKLNGHVPSPGQEATDQDIVTLDNHPVTAAIHITTIMLNKPVGYVCSRMGQGSKTIYELLPPGLGHLKPVGRLDKDSSGLLLLTNDGKLANQLTHPSFAKEKVYEIVLNRSLDKSDYEKISTAGVDIGDGRPSRLQLAMLGSTAKWEVRMREGRNRQIRRSFSALNYTVTRLHRTQFGAYSLDKLPVGKFQTTIPAPATKTI